MAEAHFPFIIGPKYADMVGGGNRFDLERFIGQVSISGYGVQLGAMYVPTFRTFMKKHRDLSQSQTLLESKVLQNTVKDKTIA